MLKVPMLALRLAEAGQMMVACPVSDSDVVEAGPVRLLAKNWPVPGSAAPLSEQLDSVPWMLPPTVWGVVVSAGARATAALRPQLAMGTTPALAVPARAPPPMRAVDASVASARVSRPRR